jgi:hypothetical protein
MWMLRQAQHDKAYDDIIFRRHCFVAALPAMMTKQKPEVIEQTPTVLLRGK